MCGKREFIYGKTGAGRCDLRPTQPSGICRRRSRQAGADFAERRFTALKNRFVRNVKGGTAAQNPLRSELPPPCRVCCLVKNPAACENKECRPWRMWFINTWNRRRSEVLREIGGEAQVLQGVSVGGRRYYNPDDLRQYLENNPCAPCPMGRGNCKSPCRVKQNWEIAKEKAK